MKRATSSLLLAALALTGAQLIRAADGAHAPPHLLVDYSNVDLSTIEGVKDMYGRLHTAAEKVCNDLDGQYLSLRYACVRDAMSNAVQSVNKPLLTWYYTRRDGGSELATVAKAK
jgi:UrcA family protein